MIKFYSDATHYDPAAFYYLTDIIRPFWDAKLNLGRGSNPEIAQLFELVDEPQAADIFLLPAYWDYYLTHQKVNLAHEFAHQAALLGKSVIVWATGDFEAVIPFKNAIVFRASLTRIPGQRRQFAFPSLFNDYVPTYLNGHIEDRQKEKLPVIGFCGQGRSRWHRLILWTIKNAVRHIDYRLGRSDYVPGPLIPHILLRSRVLKLLMHSDLVKTNFNIQDRYMGGAMAAERKNPQSQVKRQFIENIVASDYTVCVRGTGNYSMRFYETLCLGRIPIFINTDSVLPYDFAVDWKQFSVWIEKHEIPQIAEKVADFHATLSPSGFVDLQHACRNIWEDRLCFSGFYAHFYEHLAITH